MTSKKLSFISILSAFVFLVSFILLLTLGIAAVVSFMTSHFVVLLAILLAGYVIFKLDVKLMEKIAELEKKKRWQETMESLNAKK